MTLRCPGDPPDTASECLCHSLTSSYHIDIVSHIFLIDTRVSTIQYDFERVHIHITFIIVYVMIILFYY